MNDSDERDLSEGIRSLYVLDPAQRRLLTFSTTVRKSLGSSLTQNDSVW